MTYKQLTSLCPNKVNSSFTRSLGLVIVLLGLSACAARTNYVKLGGDYSTDSSQCNEEVINAQRNAKDAGKPNELNTPQSLQYTSPFESCMVSKGWSPEKTEFRLNSLKMTW